ncbi:IniB N-terminal domain-containing protein [Micromonospora sp. NPDC050686]|uniref:IniB N-terminal domain-containing protein n=1 Tax=Micromonospora sp. NPDC050686 TaxID=3154631 RepID=UPI003410A624
MESHQTLHDFVFNLLTDPDARSAFDLDPEGTLRAAGLSDITAADVRDVVPLVVDYAPAQDLAPLAQATGQFGPDLLGVDAVGQLQAVTQQISIGGSYTGLDANAGALGAIVVDPGSVAAGATLFPGVGLGFGPGGVGADLSGAHDVAHTLDADVVGGADAVADPVVGGLTGSVGDVDGLLGAPDAVLNGDLGVVGGGLSGTPGQVEGVVGSLGVDNVVPSVPDTVSGLHGTVYGAGETVDDLVPPIAGPAAVGGVTDEVNSTVSGITGAVGGVSAGGSAGVGGDGAHGEVAASTGGLLGLSDGPF